MLNGKSIIEEQSILLDIDFERKKIKGLTKIKLNFYEKSILEQDLPAKISLCAKQIDIKKIFISEIDIEMSKQEPKLLNITSAAEFFDINWNYPELLNQVLRIMILIIEIIQANQLEKLTNNIRSLSPWIKYTRANQEYENHGILNIEISKKTKFPVQKFTSIPGLEIKWVEIVKLYITIAIEYEICSPISGIHFHQVGNNPKEDIFLFNDNKVTKFIKAQLY